MWLDTGTEKSHGKQGFVDLYCRWGKTGEGSPNLLLQGWERSGLLSLLGKLLHFAWKRRKNIVILYPRPQAHGEIILISRKKQSKPKIFFYKNGI